jgi:histone H3/H4
MAKRKNIFSINYFERIFKEAGAERVSRKAAEFLENHIEEIVKEILVEANKIAKNSKRRTIMREDIKIAIKKLRLA